MADYGSSFRRTSRSSSSREDPRLSRRGSESRKDSVSPGKQSNWQGHHSGQYPMQTSYQHLQGTMYSDPNQYSTQGYQNTYGGYSNYSTTGYSSYEGYGHAQQTGYAPSGTMQPGPPGDEYPQGGWAPVGTGYVSSQQQASTSSSDKHQHTDGIAQEIEHQKAELIKQRDEYNKRVSVLRKELDLLRRQKQELMQDHSTDRNTDMILRENGKLQIEIQNKLKDAYKVIDIFTGLIGDEGRRSRKEENESPSKRDGKRQYEVYDSKYNYVHYDPELHWCRMCDVFPKTAKDLLIHLQSKEHRMNVQEDEIPWHKLPPEPEFPYTDGAPTKRHPIKGLQFFVSTPAWYCRLCDCWIGDLHCASHHLKSIKHSQNYSNFVEQNPHWEIEWLKDREKALSRVSRHNRSSDSDDIHDKKKKHKKRSSSPGLSREKRKKKRSKKRRKDSSDSSSSSSSSSSSEEEEENKDTSKSIHVAMRNKMKLQAQMLMNEELTGKWEAIGRLVEEHKKKEVDSNDKEEEDQMINQWMTVKQPQDKDKALLSNLKDRLKQKQEAEKLKYAEIERRRLEKEKEERDLKEREEKEMRDREEAKRKEKDDMERLKEIREQVKFKTRGAEKDRYHRKKSISKSPDYRRKDSRSPSSERRRKSPEKHRRYENGRRSNEYENSPRHKRKYEDKKPPPPPPYKKLPFIGRMPLFKNKKPDDKTENREIKKEDYDIPRQTRFQPGNLARAFIPEPEVVCFPKLSCYPEIAPPPPAPKIAEPPAPPKISETIPKAPPPPKINEKEQEPQLQETKIQIDEKVVDNTNVVDMMIMEDDNPLNDYHEPGFDNTFYDYSMMYQPPVFEYQSTQNAEDMGGIPLSHTMPLQPPPLPPDDPNDDLAMLGISSDDLAVQIVK